MIVKAWKDAWERVIPFFAFPPAIRRVIYTTNAIESVNAQLRKIIKTRGHFPTDDAAIKLLWLRSETSPSNGDRPHTIGPRPCSSWPSSMRNDLPGPVSTRSRLAS